MTDSPKQAEMRKTMSALKVQRDSAHRKLTRLETENRLLRKHQAEIRDWLTKAIDQYGAARKAGGALEVADELINMAAEKLGAAQRILPP